MNQYIYDSESDYSFNVYECLTCGSKFYGGGDPTHNRGCANKSDKYDNLVCHFTKFEAQWELKNVFRYSRNVEDYPMLVSLRTNHPTVFDEITVLAQEELSRG